MATGSDFYLRYYIGHEGKFGHEFLEFEITSSGRLRYSNNSNYKNDTIIRKQAYLSGMVLNVIRDMILNSEILSEEDSRWPRPDKVGKQQLEISIDGKSHIFITSKLGSLQEIQRSSDPNGLRVFYYLVQDLKALIFSIVSLHFRIKPV